MSEEAVVETTKNVAGNRTTRAPSAWASVARAYHTPLPGLFRATGLFGKDFIRHLPVPLLIIVVAAALMQLTIFLTPVARRAELIQQMVIAAPHVILWATVLIALACALACGADEEESGSRELLDGLPRLPLGYLGSKLAACVALVLFSLLLGALVIGPVCRISPISLLHSLRGIGLPSSPDDNFGHSVTGTFALIFLFIITTGLGLALYFRGLATSAVACIFLAMIYVPFLIASAFDSHGNMYPKIAAIGVLWSFFMTAVASNCLAHPRERAKRSVSEDVVSAIFSRHDQRSRRPFLSPDIYLVRTPGLLMTILMAALTLLFTTMLGRPDGSALAVTPWFAVLIGVFAIAPDERETQRGLMYLLPVSISRIFWARVARIAKWVIIASFVQIAVMWAFRQLLLLNDENRRIEPLQWIFILAAVAIAGFASAMLGFLMRLFHRPALIAVFLAVAVGVAWATILGMGGLLAQSGGYYPEPLWVVVFLTWIALVLLILPLFTAWFTFCKTPLLQQTETDRSLFSLYAAAFVIVWGVFLCAIDPYDVVTIFSR